jgi:PAS domain S-box-containing protein
LVLCIVLAGAMLWQLSRLADPIVLAGLVVLLLATIGVTMIIVRRHSLEWMSEITDNIPCVVYQFRRRADGESRFTFVSGGIRELVGLEPGQVLADAGCVFDRVLPEDLGPLQEAIDHSAQTLELFQFEFRARHVDGRTRWMRARSRPRRKVNDTVVWDGYWVDISSQRESRRALSFSEQHRKMAVEVSRLGTWTYDAASGKIDWSERCAEIFGFDRTEEVPLEQIEQRAQIENAIQDSIDHRDEYRANYKVVWPTGEVRWVSVAGRAFCDENDEPLYMEGIVLDISEHKEIEDRLASTVALLTTQQDVSPDGILATDSNFDVLSWNRNFAEMWRLDDELLESGSSQAVLEHMRGELAEPDQFSEQIEELEDKLDGRTFQEFRMKDGRVIEEVSAPMPDRDGKSAGRVWYYRDVTRRKRSEEALHEAKEAAEAANHAKSSFLATMSHEIRTPMNGVVGMLELLSLTDLDADQRTSLRVIHESTKSLQRLIDDILDLSKIEADKLDIDPEPASIEQVMADVDALFSGAAISRGIDFSCSVDSGIPPAVMIDSLRLKQILNNLISNALKFTPEGKIRVRAEREQGTDDDDWIRFSVSDTGIGIAAEYQEKLFQPFTQADQSITRHFGGTGLGLTICKRLAGLMGGSIEMNSTPGQGTTMTVTLPLELARTDELPEHSGVEGGVLKTIEADQRRSAPTVDQAEQEGTLVLVVDDHPTNRLVVVRQLNALGYAAETAEDGVQALELWKTGRFGLLLLDVNMPRMDGFEVTKNIRELEAEDDRKPTPVIAWTANALRGDAEACFLAGMDDYLPKPAQMADLKEKMNYWLPIETTEPGETGESAREDGHANDPLDRSVLAVIAGDDANVIREILEDFRRSSQDDFDSLEQAVESGDAEMLRSAAHRMKGSSRMVGAKRLSEISERLEHAASEADWDGIRSGLKELVKELEVLDEYIRQL